MFVHSFRLFIHRNRRNHPQFKKNKHEFGEAIHSFCDKKKFSIFLAKLSKPQNGISVDLGITSPSILR